MSNYPFDVGVSMVLGAEPETDPNLQALLDSPMKHVEIGYTAHCTHPGWAATVRSRIADSPVRINSVHAPFSHAVDISRLDPGRQDIALEQIGKAMSVAAKLGAAIVVVHGSAEPIGDDQRAQRLEKSKESLAQLAQQAQDIGVRIALELLPRTCLGNTAEELIHLLDGIGEKSMGVCLDCNHLAEPAQLNDTVHTLGERIITLHVSDYDGIDERHWMPFEGIIDWGSYANALRAIGYSGAFVYEAKLEGDTMADKLGGVRTNFDRILQAAARHS